MQLTLSKRTKKCKRNQTDSNSNVISTITAWHSFALLCSPTFTFVFRFLQFGGGAQPFVSLHRSSAQIEHKMCTSVHFPRHNSWINLFSDLSNGAYLYSTQNWKRLHRRIWAINHNWKLAQTIKKISSRLEKLCYLLIAKMLHGKM